MAGRNERAAAADGRSGMSAPVALVTGVTGQDGAHLAHLLLAEGCTVHGLRRRASADNTGRLDALCGDWRGEGRFRLHDGDLADAASLVRLVAETEPDEIYNLAAQSHVQVSFRMPEYSADVNALGTLRLLEAVRTLGAQRRVRFLQASTSEMYGNAACAVQDEATPFAPRSPYAAAKAHAYWSVVNYRDAYGLHASNGICFNHESPLRGETFATRKITLAAAAIARGRQRCLHLGNLDARRDWGHARDYVEGMRRIARHPGPGDYVLATGVGRSVREFAELAFAVAGIEIAWEGEGLAETGRDARTGAVRVAVDPRHFRPSDVDSLVGDAGLARRVLGWRPRTTFRQLVTEMVEADLALVDRRRAASGGGRAR